MVIEEIRGRGGPVLDGVTGRGEVRVPGEHPPEPPASTRGEPTALDAAELGALLTGDPIADALLLQHEDFRMQRQSERRRQVAERREQVQFAESAYDQEVAAAAALRHSAWLNAAVSGASIVGGASLPASDADSGYWERAAHGVSTEAPRLVQNLDEGFGPAAEARDRRIAAERADSLAIAASKREEDAGDQVQELRRLESRVLEILEQIQNGRSRSASAASSQRA